MNERAYCPRCREHVTFHSKRATRTTEMDGVEYSYPVTVAICDVCGDVATYKPYQEQARTSFAEAVHEQRGVMRFGDLVIDPDEDAKKLRRAKIETITLCVLCLILIAACVIGIPQMLAPLSEMKS